MGRFFNMDNPVFEALGRLADLMILNLIFMLTCLPVVTIGASCTAMSYVTLKFVKHEENYIVRSYFKSFKENFRQATIIWVVILLFVAILSIDFRLLDQMGGLGGKMKIALFAVCIILFMVYIYIFPVLSRFVNTCLNTVKNSFVISVVHFPTSILLMVIDVAAVALTFVNTFTITWGTFFWVICGFSTISYVNSRFLVKIFEKYMPKEEEAAADTFISDDPAAYTMTAFKNLQPQPFTSDEEEDNQ